MSGATALVMAALSNGPARVRVLLKHGADPNEQSAHSRETGVHIAARYGYIEVLRLLLEGGANPLLLDVAGNSPLDAALKPIIPNAQRPSAATQSAVTALLKQHVDKYQNHLRSRTAKAQQKSGSSASSSTTAAAATSAGVAGGAALCKDACDHCGVVPEGRKVQKCSRCSLRAYCGRECQRADWPTHKFPCGQVRDRVQQLLDTAASPSDRMHRARTLAESPAVHKLAPDAKVIPQLVAALESDKVITGGWLPSLIAVNGLLRDLTETNSYAEPPNAKTPTPMRPVALEQFVAAQGPTAVLKVLGRGGLCNDQLIDSIRGMSAVMRLWQVSKPLVSKGLAPQVVQLLKPFVEHSSSKVMANATFCLSQLLRTEQHLLKLQQQQQQAAEQPAAEQQQQQREVPPVAAAVLQHIDLRKPAQLEAPGQTRKGFFFQATMELVAALLHSKAAFKALRAQQPEVFASLLQCCLLGTALAATEGWAVNVESLMLCYRHGGLELFSQQLRPLLLRFAPVVDEDRKPLGIDGFVDLQGLGFDWDMLSRGLFISNLLDAAEHDTPTVQKCSRCSLRAYCGRECQRADWPTHKFPCGQLKKQISPFQSNMLRGCVAWPAAMNAASGQPPGVRAPTPMRPAAVEQFVAAQGPTAVLKALARRGMCDEQRIDTIRGIACIKLLRQVSKPLVSKGLAPQVVQLLKPFVQEGSRSLMTNSAFCLSQLLRTEQHLLKLQQQQAAEQPAAEQQQQQREVPPVAAAVLDHINLMKLAEPQGPGNSRKGFFFQATMEFWPSLLQSKPAFKALRCYRHGGLELFSQQLRPLLLRFAPVVDEDRKPLDCDSLWT
ncbi:hypothetical protein OEZ86_006054 [Tetradesmus obliquus]|nr:hypothetical protein OEZ86_006054 [Tetradesmus obliquus]